MHAPQNVDVAGRAMAVVERDGAQDLATGRALTGSWLWDSAVVLATHLASVDPSTFLGVTVLELGAGTGLPGIAAVACLGAARCVLTDVRPLLPGLRANAEANGLTPAQADVRELRWGDEDDLVRVDPVDVVLMSDVFYDPEEMPALAATLRALWRDGMVMWAASEVRCGVQECVDVLREQGLDVAEVNRHYGKMSLRRAVLSSPSAETRGQLGEEAYADAGQTTLGEATTARQTSSWPSVTHGEDKFLGDDQTRHSAKLRSRRKERSRGT